MKAFACFMVLFVVSFLISVESLAQSYLPSQWLTIIQKEAKEFNPPEKLRSILNGCGIYSDNYYERDNSDDYSEGDKVWGNPLSAKELKDVAHFEAFMKGAEGKEIIRKVLAGAKLTYEEQPYFYLAQVVIFNSARRVVKKKEAPHIPLDIALANKHVEKYKNVGEKLLKKGFQGKAWSRQELDSVRIYAIYIKNKYFGNHLLPYTLGIWREPIVNSWQTDPASLKQGLQPPDFSVPDAKLFWRSPAFSDRNPHKYISILSPQVLLELLNIQAGYERNEEGVLVAKANYELEDISNEHIFRLSDFVGKKPVFLMLSGPSDAFIWHGRISTYVNHLYQIFGDQVKFVVVATTTHDDTMPGFTYYRPKSEGQVKDLYVHPLSLEERAREVKFFYMTKPDMIYPYYLDNTAQHVRNDYFDEGGAASVYLINKDGTIGFNQKKASYIRRHINLYGRESSIWHDISHTTFHRTNAIEQALLAMLENDGQVPEGFEPQLSPLKKIEDHRGSVMLTGHVTSLKEDKLVLKAQWQVEKMVGYHLWKTEKGARVDESVPRANAIKLIKEWVEEEGGNLTKTFQVKSETLVTINGKQTTSAEIKTGDQIGIIFMPIDALDNHVIPAYQIRVTRM